MKTPQKTAVRAFTNVGCNDSITLKNIFTLLRKQSGEVRGRSDAGNPEMRKKIEQFAKGKVPPELVNKICEEFSVSPETMEMLARALNKAADETSE